MKKCLLKKLLATTLTCLTIFLALPTSVFAATTGWVNHGPYWSYNDSDGSAHKGWLKDGDKWYYFADGGWMEKGTKTIKGKTYFFSDSGELLNEIPTKQGVIASTYGDKDGAVNEVKCQEKSEFKNEEVYLVNGKYVVKRFNADGTVAANTIFEPISYDGKEHHWEVTDEYGYYADYKTKVELNGRVYIQIDDGWGGESNITTTDPGTGEILYITRDESLGKDRHPMCLAKDEWWYGYGSEEGWHYIDSMNKPEKNLWKQSEDKTKWFYLDDKGKMQFNKWIKSGDNWYYVGTDGHMLTNTTIKGYYLGDEWRYVATGGYVPTDTTINEYSFGADGKLI